MPPLAMNTGTISSTRADEQPFSVPQKRNAIILKVPGTGNRITAPLPIAPDMPLKVDHLLPLLTTRTIETGATNQSDDEPIVTSNSLKIPEKHSTSQAFLPSTSLSHAAPSSEFKTGKRPRSERRVTDLDKSSPVHKRLKKESPSLGMAVNTKPVPAIANSTTQKRLMVTFRCETLDRFHNLLGFVKPHPATLQLSAGVPIPQITSLTLAKTPDRIRLPAEGSARVPKTLQKASTNSSAPGPDLKSESLLEGLQSSHLATQATSRPKLTIKLKKSAA